MCDRNWSRGGCEGDRNMSVIDILEKMSRHEGHNCRGRREKEINWSFNTEKENNWKIISGSIKKRSLKG